MPIEIRELHIKAVIDGGGGKDSSQAGEAGASAGASPVQDADQLIERCIEKVLEILKEKEER
jgi:hypothetical protein